MRAIADRSAYQIGVRFEATRKAMTLAKERRATDHFSERERNCERRKIHFEMPRSRSSYLPFSSGGRSVEDSRRTRPMPCTTALILCIKKLRRDRAVLTSKSRM